MRPHEMLVTKAQAELLLRGWECSEPVPGKGRKVFVAFPCRGPEDVDLAEVSWTEHKSDAGDRLWSVVQSSRAGRLFAETVQEAHVVAFREARFAAHLERKAGERTVAEVQATDPDLPLWAGAKEAYTAAYAMLRKMATELGHVRIVRDRKGKPVGSESSQDMRDIIEALNKGDEEQVKGYLALGRTYGWAA